MNNLLKNKKVSIGGKNIITDWRNIKVVSPGNLQRSIRANEDAEKEIRKQKKVIPTSSNTAIIAV